MIAIDRVCSGCRVRCLDVDFAWSEDHGASVCSWCRRDVQESDADPVDHEAREECGR